MKIFTCLFLALCFWGCDKTQPPKTKGDYISVGMAYQDAEPILTAAGGMHVDIDNIKDTDTHILEVNKFPNKTMVLIEIEIESRKITNLKICVDPDISSENYTWKPVKTFVPSID